MGKLIIPLDSNLCPDAAVTKTANYNGAALDLGGPPDVMYPVGVIINVTALDHADGNETYSFTIEESADNSSWTSTGQTFTPTAVGNSQTIVPVTKRYVRAHLTVGGTTPSLTYSAYFGPIAA